MDATARDHVDRIVEAWRRERPDLDTRALAVFGRLFRIVHLADVKLAEGSGAYGLQSGWFDILAALRRAGSPYELHPTALMQTTLLSSGGVSKRLDRVADAGLVERRPDPDDRRATLVRLTEEGKTVIDAALVTHVRNEERLLAGLEPEKVEVLNSLLRRLLAGLE